jgi:hypothetical protein
MVGAAVALRGALTPIYFVGPDLAERVYLDWCTSQGSIDRAVGQSYQALFTDHYAWMDTGIGLMLGATALAMLAVTLWRTAPPGAPWLRTPRARWLFLALGLAVIGMGQAVTIESFKTDVYRRYVPSCADSWGIPVTQSNAAAVVITIVLLPIGTILTLMFGKLPAPLGRWDGMRPIRSWVVTIVFSLLMLFVVAVGVGSLATDTSGWIVPVVLAFYLLAATRAALLAPRRVAQPITGATP